MEHQEDLDQFRILEEKIGTLLGKVSSLKDERESISARFKEQDKIIGDLKKEIEILKSTRDNTKARIQSILDKIGKIDI